MSNKQAEAVVWPGGSSTARRQSLAPRISTLEGKRIGFLWDYLFRGEEVFEILQQGLIARYPKVEFVGYEAFGSTYGVDERKVLDRLPAKLRDLGIEAVISGVGG